MHLNKSLKAEIIMESDPYVGLCDIVPLEHIDLLGNGLHSFLALSKVL